MPEHTPLPVAGYTNQNDKAIATVNHHKAMEERLLRQLDALDAQNFGNPRWRAIARSHFEEGFMALNRSIFQPKRISLPEDAK